ncbi:hypothetical protein [Piscirickettsia litoralis]|uniref:Uncharacterized protein n=1 Tax=Piscirickettsia litoralis TaxID=1891921 RepID=A0ABX3A087_9GAMM|nr:hypothetical protein [Piscirickettsia litoralis]ODN41677.1 hypothetical protein BGC07_00120 [Piscirickettsia litoralis]
MKYLIQQMTGIFALVMALMFPALVNAEAVSVTLPQQNSASSVQSQGSVNSVSNNRQQLKKQSTVTTQSANKPKRPSGGFLALILLLIFIFVSVPILFIIWLSVRRNK